MRYLGLMTDLPDDRTLSHLAPAEMRLGALLTRPLMLAMACVVTLTGLGGAYLGILAAGHDGLTGFALVEAICRPARSANSFAVEFVVVLSMWAAMTLAMMLPTAGPMILTYAEIADTAARKGERVVSPFTLAAGYLAVWLSFAALVAILQMTLTRAGLLDTNTNALDGLLPAAIFAAEGLYQFSSLKQSCLHRCQRPFPFFFTRWTNASVGVLWLGLEQGLYCLGCCWAMMLAMFAVGVMNVTWMAVLGIVMTIEKMTTTRTFSRVLGAAFLVLGMCFAMSALM